MFVRVPKDSPIRTNKESPTTTEYAQWMERAVTEGWEYEWTTGWRSTKEDAEEDLFGAKDAEMPQGEQPGSKSAGGGAATEVTGGAPKKTKTGELDLKDGKNVHEEPYILSTGTEHFVQATAPPAPGALGAASSSAGATGSTGTPQ